MVKYCNDVKKGYENAENDKCTIDGAIVDTHVGHFSPYTNYRTTNGDTLSLNEDSVNSRDTLRYSITAEGDYEDITNFINSEYDYVSNFIAQLNDDSCIIYDRQDPPVQSNNKFRITRKLTICTMSSWRFRHLHLREGSASASSTSESSTATLSISQLQLNKSIRQNVWLIVEYWTLEI